MTELPTVAPAFIEMAHRIVWCTVATVDIHNNPTTRVLHPIWEWDGQVLRGWIATSPLSPKAKHVAHNPRISLTYWSPNQDVCTADCSVQWKDSAEEKHIGWERFAKGPAPVGYNPGIIPGWTSPEVEGFGILELQPNALRVMPGTVLMSGVGEVLTWKQC
jgi:Pyridoxamine 5'-phosphate oxidase